MEPAFADAQGSAAEGELAMTVAATTTAISLPPTLIPALQAVTESLGAVVKILSDQAAAQQAAAGAGNVTAGGPTEGGCPCCAGEA
ncbi:MAG: hypothetical protein JWN72_311, partial [Thermoleophilia bacterium]|nr:hypothetical protein [Thermoleophilia bacterium]